MPGEDPREPASDENAAFEAAWLDIVARLEEPAVHDPSGAADLSADPDDPDERVEGLGRVDDDALGNLRDTDRLPPMPDLDDPALLTPDPLPVWSPEPETEPETTFVPPTPPLPRSTPERWTAWITLIGVPVIVVLCTVVGYRPVEMVSWFLGAAWLGSFAYLVATMNDGPAEPWDDGSRV